MDHSANLYRPALGCLVVGMAALWLLVAAVRAGPAPDPPRVQAVYHPDPQHLWNRLHKALFVRTGPDGRAYGHDCLEPLLWPWSKHLLEPRSCDRVVDLLDEFLRSQGEKRIEDPVKRAVLQRDLWLVFNWVEGDHGNFADPQLGAEAWRGSQQRLRGRLAAVIGRLALSPDQIRGLPDNYAAAVASEEYSAGYDPERPDRPYLPPDLFAASGPWVCAGRPDGPVAPQHLRDENPFTNSAFLVLLRLPGGRAATLAYLERLRSFDHPLMVRSDGGAFVPNPRLPQLPAGTQVALVRRALLIASPAQVIPSPVTESIQLRVYREVPELTKQVLDAALGGGTAGSLRAHSWQSFHEFRLSRLLLFGGRAGGLRPVSDEPDFKTGLGAHPWDEFETCTPQGRPFPGAGQVMVKETCFPCHSLPGVYSFNTFFSFRTARGTDDPRPASLRETIPSEVLGSAARWKQERPHWASLRGLLAK
jgi:hypothetical protein